MVRLRAVLPYVLRTHVCSSVLRHSLDPSTAAETSHSNQALRKIEHNFDSFDDQPRTR